MLALGLLFLYLGYLRTFPHLVHSLYSLYSFYTYIILFAFTPCLICLQPTDLSELERQTDGDYNISGLLIKSMCYKNVPGMMSPEQEMKQQHTCIVHARIMARSIFQQMWGHGALATLVKVVCSKCRSRDSATYDTMTFFPPTSSMLNFINSHDKVVGSS